MPDLDPFARKPRFEGRRFWALLAADTFDPVVERITAMLSHDRRMVRIDRTVNKKGADDLRIHVGLRLDTETPNLRGELDGGISVSTTTSPRETGPLRHFEARLGPGFHNFGFTVDGRTEDQMRPLYDRRGENYDAPVDRIHIDGWPNSPSRDDSIEIERWNEHRVCTLTTVVFQANWG